jgi:hypothetical protein
MVLGPNNRQKIEIKFSKESDGPVQKTLEKIRALVAG